MPFGYGAPGFYRPWGFGFGFLGCLFPLFGIFLVFGLLRAMFWRGHWGGHRGHWGHGGPNEQGVPPMVAEWHRKMHGEAQPEAPKAQ